MISNSPRIQGNAQVRSRMTDHPGGFEDNSKVFEVDHRELYRLPWNLADNAISWLEPTSACNLACDGCYRENVAKSHKPIEAVREEIDVFLRLRNSDGISIAGGEPLMHPDIVEIVRHIASRGI